MNIYPMTYEFSSMSSMRACLKKGLGITICPEVSIKEELKTKQLIILNNKIIDDETSVIMIWHAQKWCSPILKNFLEISENLIQ